MRSRPPSLPTAHDYKPATHPVIVYLASLSPPSRRTQAAAIRKVAQILVGASADPLQLAWHEVRYAHTQAVRSVLAETLAPATANRVLSALRAVLRESWRLGWMTGEQYQRATDLKPVRGERLPAGRELDHGEILALFRACDHSPRGRRDACLLAVLYGGGLRRSEAVGLDLHDVDLDRGGVHVRRGKGNKERVSWLASGATDVILSWLELRGTEEGPLLFPVLKGGRIVARRLSAQTVLDALRVLAKKAGVRPFSPHDARRSWISHLLARGADAGLICKMSGHANVQTLLAYDRRPEKARRDAGRLIHIPAVAHS